MEFLLLGIGVGLVTVAAPGPISMSIIQVATVQGRNPGVQAAAGATAGEWLVGACAVLVVSLGANLPGQVFGIAQIITAAVLVLVGLAMLGRPSTVAEHASTIARPARALLAIATLMPSAIGSWVALLAAMPFAGERLSLASFTLGVGLVALVWYPFLGLTAGALGPRLTPRTLRIATRVGGVATLALGLWALVGD